MNIFDHINLSDQDQANLLEGYPEAALRYACAKLKTSKSPVRSPYGFIKWAATDYCKKNNVQKANFNSSESPQESLGDYTQPQQPVRKILPANNSPDYIQKRQYHEDGTYTGEKWEEKELNLKVVNDLPPVGEISAYPIQGIADELRNWQQILDGYLKQAKKTISESNLAMFVDTDERIKFAKEQIKRLVTEFNKRPPEEQALAK